MKRTLAGVALIAAMLLSIALSSEGKPWRGRFGFAADISSDLHPDAMNAQPPHVQ